MSNGLVFQDCCTLEILSVSGVNELEKGALFKGNRESQPSLPTLTTKIIISWYVPVLEEQNRHGSHFSSRKTALEHSVRLKPVKTWQKSQIVGKNQVNTADLSTLSSSCCKAGFPATASTPYSQGKRLSCIYFNSPAQLFGENNQEDIHNTERQKHTHKESLFYIMQKSSLKCLSLKYFVQIPSNCGWYQSFCSGYPWSESALSLGILPSLSWSGETEVLWKQTWLLLDAEMV